ncbi:IS3 family transposase [Thalassobacillus sp. B23F22_16]|uniref:IS3 family transposase n=1 Tax=Thalassobacillus sp. B23F22_16 TaxID=3459513 RepID=UPI00373E3923
MKKGNAHLHARKRVKFEFIYEHRTEHTVSKMCEVLGVSTSGYYAYLHRLEQPETEREAFNRYLDERILFHYHDNHGCYGSPRIHKKIRDEDGLSVSVKKVTNRMRELELYAVPPKKFVATTDSKHANQTFPNHLKREFQPEAPNKVWATDITYIHTGEGFLYLNPVMDLYSRRIISFRIDDHMEQSLSLHALEEAISLREPEAGWIHHSDQGSQYCSRAYVKTLEEAQATISMSRKGTPYDNACVESFFASFKKEYLYKYVFPTKAEAILAVQFYIKFYNQKRMHSFLDDKSPIEKEKAYYSSQSQKLASAHIPSA